MRGLTLQVELASRAAFAWLTVLILLAELSSCAGLAWHTKLASCTELPLRTKLA